MSVYPARDPDSRRNRVESPDDAARRRVELRRIAREHARRRCRATTRKPTEIYAIDAAARSSRSSRIRTTRCSRSCRLGATEEVSFKSKDGTEVHGLLTKPVGYVAGHEGAAAAAHSRRPERAGPAFVQLRAAVVRGQRLRGAGGELSRQLGPRRRSSRGRSSPTGDTTKSTICRPASIRSIKMGVADPDRLGVGGWSYGGILTDYMIASDTRFKAATSGAGTAFTVAFYGTDQYIIQYDYEIGPPWDPKAWETYQKISYPFLHADRIKTPTLFLGGERDFNVPVQGGQQMYQALRSLGIDTQLVIYPNEFHGITRPSYVRDRYERYLGVVRQIREERAPDDERAAVTLTRTATRCAVHASDRCAWRGAPQMRASPATPSSSAATIANVGASSGLTPNSSVRSVGARTAAARAPSATPSAASTIPPRRSRPPRADGRAPRASRMPISCVRCATRVHHDAVDADGGEQQRDPRQARHQQHVESLWRGGGRHRFGERLEVATARRGSTARTASRTAVLRASTRPSPRTTTNIDRNWKS